MHIEPSLSFNYGVLNIVAKYWLSATILWSLRKEIQRKITNKTILHLVHFVCYKAFSKSRTYVTRLILFVNLCAIVKRDWNLPKFYFLLFLFSVNHSSECHAKRLLWMRISWLKFFRALCSIVLIIIKQEQKNPIAIISNFNDIHQINKGFQIYFLITLLALGNAH